MWEVERVFIYAHYYVDTQLKCNPTLLLRSEPLERNLIEGEKYY